jgi:Glycosyl transferases group 1
VEATGSIRRVAEKLRRLENIRFVMIGKPSNDRQWLSSLQDRISNTKALTHLGEVTQDIVNEYLAKSHLFVSTSEVEGSQTLLSRPGSGNAGR